MNDPNESRFASPWPGRVRLAPKFVSAAGLQRIAGNRGTQRLLGIGDGRKPAEPPLPPSLTQKLAGRWKKLSLGSGWGRLLGR